MSILTPRSTDGYLFFDEEECRARGTERASEYQNADPFPHIAMDDFLDPALLRRVSAEYPARDGKAFFDRDQERLKYQYTPAEASGGLTRNLLAELNSSAFLAFLEEMTGITGLISDPYYAGGGLHETCRGGHLGVHADFNIHKVMKLERRLNLLVYLNDDWDPSYGGELELWERDMSGKKRSIAPLIGRAVVFNTSLDSYHGHPDPLQCPPERTRRSLATYYYTAFTEGLADVPVRTTKFRPRKGSQDKLDWRIGYVHWVNDWIPPKLQRIARWPANAVGRAAKHD